MQFKKLKMSIDEVNQYISTNSHLIIFDCDGTLADTEKLHLKTWHKVFENNPYFEEIIEFFVNSTGIPASVSLQQIQKKYQIDLDLVQLNTDKKKAFVDLSDDIEPIEEIVQIAHNYFQKIPMSISSGGSFLEVSTTLKKIGITHLFDEIITADNNIKPKPNPEIFLYHCEKNNIPAEKSIVFEDSMSGINAANQANIPVYDVINQYLII